MANGVEVADSNLPSTELKNKTFSSRTLSPKDRIEGSGSITTDGSGNGTATITHNLPYPPAHLFFFNPGNTNKILHPGTASWIDAMSGTDWGLMDNFTFTVKSEVLTCTITIQGIPSIVYKFKYFIFVEPAKT